jgi:hypothetical protein
VDGSVVKGSVVKGSGCAVSKASSRDSDSSFRFLIRVGAFWDSRVL